MSFAKENSSQFSVKVLASSLLAQGRTANLAIFLLTTHDVVLLGTLYLFNDPVTLPLPVLGKAA